MRRARRQAGPWAARLALPWVAWAPPFEAVTPNPQLESLIPGFAPVFTADNYLVMLAADPAGWTKRIPCAGSLSL